MTVSKAAEISKDALISHHEKIRAAALIFS